MACTNPNDPNCPNCNKSGLAILPVRYAVVPNAVDATLPATLGNKVTSVKLTHAKYALRTLRQGFVFLFYEKHARGSHIKWEVYSVAPRGTLWKQIHRHAVVPVSDDPACARQGHNIPASVITIDKPEKCGRVWMAFSEHMWSSETFDAFENDMALRDRRMQTFAPAIWITRRGYRHGMEATEANLNEVVEYKTGFSLATLAGGGGGIVPAISKPDGTYDPAAMQKQTTIHTVHVRRDDKKKTVDLMQQIGETAAGPDHAPIMVALWDSVGITHELNGFRNDAAGWIAKYAHEREVEIGGAAALLGVRKALEERAGQSAGARASQAVFAFTWTEEQTNQRLAAYQKAYPANLAGLARQQDLCRRWEHDAAQGVPSFTAQGRERHAYGNDLEWNQGNAEVDRQIAELHAPAAQNGTSYQQQREQHVRKATQAAVAKVWPKYQEHIDQAALTAFNKNYAAFNKDADAVVDGRTEDLVGWLKSTWLVNALTEFNKNNVHDGVIFEDQIGTALNGIGSTFSGQGMIDEWIKEMQATEGNLLWRAIALNQEEGIKVIDEALAHGLGSPKPLTQSAWELVAKEIKWNKIFDLGKKSLGFYNTNMKAINDPKSGMTPVTKTRGLEKILASVGHRFLQPYAKGLDSINGTAVKWLLAVRAGASPAVALQIAHYEIRRNTADADALIRRLRNNAHYIPEAADMFQKEKTALWEKLTKDADVPDSQKKNFNAARDARLSIIVALLESYNLYKTYGKLGADPSDPTAQTLLAAAILATSSAAMDLASVYVKGMHTLKDAAVGFQALKLAGGGLSVVASCIGGYLDLKSADDADQNSKHQLATLYLIRGGFQFVNSALTLLMALSYCSPMIDAYGQRLVGQAGGSLIRIVTGNVAQAAAKRVLAMRAALFLATIEVSIFVLAVTILIWSFEDDRLEKWIKRSAFGLERKKERLAFTSAETQGQELANALADIAR
ncbi:MAG: T6SS effector BTH_I2691 family protein [Pseudomonadota bacterium]